MKTSTILAAMAALTVGALIIDRTDLSAEDRELVTHILLVDDGAGGVKPTPVKGQPKNALPLMRVRAKDGYSTFRYMDPTNDGWSVVDGSHRKRIDQNWIVIDDETGREIRLDLMGMGVVGANEGAQ